MKLNPSRAARALSVSALTLVVKFFGARYLCSENDECSTTVASILFGQECQTHDLTILEISLLKEIVDLTCERRVRMSSSFASNGILTM
jgi:hypothetical protein